MPGTVTGFGCGLGRAKYSVDTLFLFGFGSDSNIRACVSIVAEELHTVVTAETIAKLELCFITRQKWSRKRSLHFVAEHFEAIFNAVRECKVVFAYN